MNSISLTSIGALDTISNINKYAQKLGETERKLSFGKSTAISDENPTNNAKARSLEADIKGFTSLVTSLNNQDIMLSVAVGGIQEQEKKALEMENIIKSSKNTSLEYREKIELTKDLRVLMDDFDNIANKTTFNDIQILNGGLENSKLAKSTQTYNHIGVDIKSTDSNKIINTRFETGANIKRSSSIKLKFKLQDNSLFELPKTIISHSANTGIGELARLINDNSISLGLKANYSVQTTSAGAILSGNLKELNINNINVGSISIAGKQDHKKLVEMINNKTDTTGVTASLHNERLVLESKDGRGISLKSTSGFNLLNLKDGDEETYGKLTIVNYNGLANGIINTRDIGFDKLSSKSIAVDYFTQGDFTKEDKQAMGIKDLDIEKKTKIDLNNGVYVDNFLNMLDNISSKLQQTKKDISISRRLIIDNKNLTLSSKIGYNKQLQNIEEIDYSKEIFNQNKFTKLGQGAAYAFTKTLDFDKKIYNILFDTLKTK